MKIRGQLYQDLCLIPDSLELQKPVGGNILEDMLLIIYIVALF